MKLKFKVVQTPGSHRRLEVFRRICPDTSEDPMAHLLPRDLLNEINSVGTFSPTPTDNNRFSTDRPMMVQPMSNSMNFSREFLPQYKEPFANTLNENTNLESQNNYRDINTELLEAIRQFQTSRRENNFIVTSPESIWNMNYSDLMNIFDYNTILQNDRNGYIPQMPFYARDLIDEINYCRMLQSRVIDNNQYRTSNSHMQFMPQSIPGPTDFTTFSVPYPEPERSMNTMNLSQSTLLDHMNFPNDRNYLEYMNYINRFSERRFIGNRNLSHSTLLNPMDLFNAILEPTPASRVNAFQPTLMVSSNFTNEFSAPSDMNDINFTQPTLFDCINFSNEFVHPIPTNTMNYMNFSNEFTNPTSNSINDVHWSMLPNHLPEYIFVPGETALSRTTPRPILNRNCLDEFSLPSFSHDPDPASSTEDYTTEYSLTHAIARPTPNRFPNGELPLSVPYAPQNSIAVEQIHFPLCYGSNGMDIPHPPGIPRPILNRSYKNEYPKPYESQNPLDGFLGPYESQNGLIDFANPTVDCMNNLYINSSFPVPDARPILNRNGFDDFLMSNALQNPELSQVNDVLTFTNPYEDFLTPHTYMSDEMNLQSTYMNPGTDFELAQSMPRSYLNHINGFPLSNNIAHTSGMAYVNGTTEPFMVSELPKLSQNVASNW